MRHARRSVGTLALVAVALAVGLGAVGAVGASTTDTTAGNVTVSLTPADSTVNPGDQVTYDVVVADATEGISAYKGTIELANTSVATVESYEHAYSPQFDNTEVYDDRVELSAAMGDNVIDGAEQTVLGSLTVTGDNQGTTDVFFADGASGVELSNATDAYYDVTDVTDSTLTVEWPDVDVTLSPANRTVGVGAQTTYDVVVSGATEGISAYKTNITLADGSVATVESYEHAYSPQFDNTEVYDDTLALSAAMGDNAIPGADETVLGTVTLSGQDTGTTAFSFGGETDIALDNQAVSSYGIGAVTDGTLEVVEQSQEATVELVPQGGVSVGGTTLGVYVSGAENGVGAYDLEFGLNSSLGSFTDYELLAEGDSGPLDNSEITDGGSGFLLTAALLDATHDPAEEIHIANVDLEIDEPGALTVQNLGGDVADVNEQKYSLTLPDRDLSVGAVPPIQGEVPPQDPNGNGLYEDIDGDGSVGVFDVQALFDNLNDPAVQSNPDLFDFDGSGGNSVDVFDVQGLFDLT